jgi:hypothetical protein
VEQERIKRQEEAIREARRIQREETERRIREEDEARQRWAAEQERIRLEEEEAEMRRRREEEEAQRLQQEEEEWERLQRLRECAVCFDSHDMRVMTQLPCNDWYCREDIQGRWFVSKLVVHHLRRIIRSLS